MKKTILLTGGSGFIGRHILEQLGEKYHFLSPSHKELDLVDSLAVDKYFKRHPVDILIHTANVGGNRKEASFPNVIAYNLRIFFNLVRNNQYFKRMIYLGTGAEYGKQLPIILAKEEDTNERIPKDDFGLYKYIVGKYIENSKEKIVNLRIFGIFGKYEEYEFRFPSNMICKAIFNLPLTINQDAVFDFIYIDDFIRILDYFINRQPQYKTYIVASGQRIHLLEIAKKILGISKKDLKIIVRKQGLNNEYTANNSRLRREIKNLRLTKYDISLKSLYLWYENIKNSISKESLL